MQDEPNKRTVVTLVTLIAVAMVVAFWLERLKKNDTSELSRSTTELADNLPKWRLSPLGQEPDWSQLDAFQQTITREMFLEDLTRYFTVSDAWMKYIDVREDHALILKQSRVAGESYRLNFAPVEQEKPIKRNWRTGDELRALADKSPEKPLAGVHIAIDPGHIGGEWAQMEARWFKIGDGLPVTEGDMTLRVATMIKPRLEALGAQVSLVRESAQPLTKDRPETLLDVASKTNPMLSGGYQTTKAAESLFYRTSEIRARAHIVNEKIRPDAVLCLHFNAVAWGDPALPTLVDENHLHILLNGAYTDDEIGYDDQRFEMLRKILQRTIHEEAALGAVMADVFAAQTGLPPYPYEPNSTRARQVANHPYLYARNLLANRIYDCPVIFFEPYVMNSHEVYERVQAGDYQGMPVVAGKPRKSIYREYADAVVDGLLEYYRKP
jgi:N-acetylmuramoyl-L-alanine amidase